MKAPPITVSPIQTDIQFYKLDTIYHHYFGSSSVPTEILRSWWKRNNNGLIGLFKNDEMIGGISIWALGDAAYDKIEGGLIKERDILSSDIVNANCNKYYISEIAVKSSERNNLNLIALLHGVIEYLISSGSFPLSILALGYSPQGINLIKRMGFIKQLNAEKTADKQPLFQLMIPDISFLHNLQMKMIDFQNRIIEKN